MKTNDETGWKPSIPVSFWTDEVFKLISDTADIIAGWANDRAKEGHYEDATTLAILSDVLQAYVDDGGFDEDFDRMCEERWERAQTQRNVQ